MKVGLVAAGLAVVLLIWLNLAHGDVFSVIASAVAAVGLGRRAAGQPGWARGLGLVGTA